MFARIRRIGKSDRRLNSLAFLQEIYAAADKHAYLVLKLYRSCVETWDEEPEFRSSVFFEGNKMIIDVGTDDPVFRFIDNGTDERWALMRPDFRAKTIPNTIGSWPGANGVPVYRGRKAFYAHERYDPQPGIEARNFTINISKVTKRSFHLDMRNAVRRGAARMMNEG